MAVPAPGGVVDGRFTVYRTVGAIVPDPSAVEEAGTDPAAPAPPPSCRPRS